MPAEVDTGGHWVLHCDSRADRPTATPIHVSIFARLAKTEESRRRALKDWRQRIKIHAREAQPTSDYRNGKSLFVLNSSARIPRIGNQEETILPARDRTQAQPPRRRRRENGLLGYLASKESPRVIENACEHLPVTWKSQESEEKERVESRLRDVETEQSDLPIADSIAGRRSLQDRSQTRLQPAVCDRKNLDTYHYRDRITIDYLRRTKITEENSFLSSHHSRYLEDDFQDVEGFFGEQFNDTRPDAKARSNRVSEQCDERSEKREKERTGKIGQDRKRIRNRRAYRVRSFLQLAFLLFLVAFGRCGLGSSGVIKFSARPTASVLGIGAIIGAVSAGSIDLTGDAGIRAERSANLSHITGASRKIQMYIKNRHLQILPDGTVNGSNGDTSDYTIFQRTSISRGQLRIQGVATCLYLCMDSCGLLYGSREYTEDCVFNETLEQHNYNTYSSVRWSTAKKTLYLGLNRHGQPRRVQAKGHNLGRLSAYARVLTQMAPFDRVEALQRRMLGAQHNVRHRHHDHGHRRVHAGDVAQQSLCPTLPDQEKDGRDRFRCRKRKKRKKRRRRCRPGEQPGPQCRVAEGLSSTMSPTSDTDASSEMSNITTPESKRSCEGAASEEACRRQALSVPAKKRKSRIGGGGGGNLTLNNGKNKASTSNAKKPNVNVADSQSKKPDLTDGKKTKRKGPPSRGNSMVLPSRKQYESGTNQAFLPSTVPTSEVLQVSTATSSSSPSPHGGSTAPFSARRLNSPSSSRKRPLSSSRNHVTRPMSSHRKGKSFSISARSKSIPISEINLPSTTKVPETTSAWYATSFPQLPQSSLVPSPSSFLWQKSAENSTNSLSNSSLVNEESRSTVTSEFTTEMVESTTEATSRLDEEDGKDNGSSMIETIPKTTMRFPIERLAM
ncbi:uncharacterized protein [Anoplolepis gracilipes]|uniref:uncharacterized protein n=1 Tax=Anoplolepis gracilipes TaxID=354296 RepID=UPI003BA0292F